MLAPLPDSWGPPPGQEADYVYSEAWPQLVVRTSLSGGVLGCLQVAQESVS